eukprot:GHVN01005980.1.p1 GENE.GHVN01005980.1~~GHVN01005980.1.p1  ORF type:complete len:267 (+),score=32.52 GHVN01005980.1:161-961(+)
MGIDTFLSSVETFVATADLGGTVLTIIWKTVGLAWLPGYDAMFGAVGTGAQYPVRWTPTFTSLTSLTMGVFYLAVYGFLGAATHYASLKLSLDGDNQDVKLARRRSKLVAFFHVIIGVHHILWALLPNWGRLDLSEFGITSWPIALSSVGTIYKGWQLGTRALTVPAMRRRKALLDTISFVSLIPTFGFLPANWVGYRNPKFEKSLWLIVPYGTLGLLAWDLLEPHSTHSPQTLHSPHTHTAADLLKPRKDLDQRKPTQNENINEN